MTPSQAQKDWATLLKNRLAGTTSVRRYYNDSKTIEIPISATATADGIVAATVGLTDINQSRNPSVALYTELMMHSRDNDETICNVLSTIAIYILKDQWRANPGTIFNDQVALYFPKTKLPHIYFTAPFDWENWGRVALSDRVINPLLAIPVSEAEANFALTQSGQELEALWKNSGTDVFNWKRASAV